MVDAPQACANDQPESHPKPPLPLHHTPESLQWEPIDLLLETLGPQGAWRSCCDTGSDFAVTGVPFLFRRSFPATQSAPRRAEANQSEEPEERFMKARFRAVFRAFSLPSPSHLGPEVLLESYPPPKL